MAISLSSLGQFALPQANINSDITPQLRQFVETINNGQKQQSLADLGKGIADGTIDYRQAAGKLASLGNPSGMMQMLALAEAKDKQAKELAASQQFSSGLSQMYGAGGGSAPPSTAPASSATVPNDSNALPGQVGMNLTLADRAQDFVQDHPNTYLSSGFRSNADQQRLYDNRASNPNPVAVPGTSNHERGLAADIGGMSAEDRAQLSQYGLSQPVANDAPHVELARNTQIASNDPAALPVNAQATQGYAVPGQAATSGLPNGLSQRALGLIQGLSNPNLPTAQREIGNKLLASELDQSKLPDQAKLYVYAKAQDPSIGSFTEWTRANKAAGAINIDQRAESGEAKAAGEAAGKRRADMFAAAGAAGKTLTNLSRMEGLLNQVSQGKVQPSRMSVSAWAKSLGLNDDVAKSIGLDPQGVGSAQALQSLVNESVLGKIGPGGFPANNFSDADRQFITQIFPSLGEDPRANKIRIEGARRMVNLDIERAKAFQQFKADPANKGRGFEDFELDWADKMSKRDVFGDLQREAQSIVGAPRNDIGATYSNPGAAPPRGATGSWGNQSPMRVTSPDDARRLPPGTRFVTPDGREFVR